MVLPAQKTGAIIAIEGLFSLLQGTRTPIFR